MDQQEQNSDLVPAPPPPTAAVPPLVQPQAASTTGGPLPQGNDILQPDINDYPNPVPDPIAQPAQTPPQNNLPNLEPARPVAPASSVMPGYDSVNVSPDSAPINTKPPRSKKIIIIIGVIALVSGIAVLIFYFAYWTRSDVVYSRFQNQIAKITTETLNTNIKLIDDTAYSFAIDSQSADIPLKASGAGRVVSGGSENTADITFSDASINLSANSVNNNSSFDLYVKYLGIQKFYDSLLKNSATESIATGFSTALPVLKKYDNKWISVDLLSTGLTSADTNEAITQEDYNTVRDKLLPIFKDRYIGLKKSGAVITTTNPKTEQVAGKSAWAYEININNDNFNAMIDEMVTAVDATALSDSKKKILKDSLDSQKDDSSDQTGTINLTTVYRIWLEKNTGLPLKFSVNTKEDFGGIESSTTDITSEISSISSKNITANLTISFKKDSYETDLNSSGSVFSSNFNVDNKTAVVSVDAFYDPDTSAENDKITGNFKLSPANDKAPATKPASTVTLEQVINELNASSQ